MRISGLVLVVCDLCDQSMVGMQDPAGSARRGALIDALASLDAGDLRPHLAALSARSEPGRVPHAQSALVPEPAAG